MYFSRIFSHNTYIYWHTQNIKYIIEYDRILMADGFDCYWSHSCRLDMLGGPNITANLYCIWLSEHETCAQNSRSNQLQKGSLSCDGTVKVHICSNSRYKTIDAIECFGVLCSSIVYPQLISCMHWVFLSVLSSIQSSGHLLIWTLQLPTLQ